MANVLFISCTSTEFKGLTAKDPNSVYWLSDTKQIYKGADLYSNNVLYVSEAPEFDSALSEMIYVVDDGSGKMQILVKGQSAMVPAGGTVDEAGVTAAINAALESYKKAVVKVESARAKDNSGTVISFTDHEGTKTDITIADLFLSAAEYDPSTHHLKLTVKGVEEPIEVDLSDLVPQAVDASQVALARNITATVDVGNIKKGQKIDVTNIQTVQDLFEAMLSQDSNPTVTQPSATITLANAGIKEVGSKFTPSYTATLNAGSYSATAEGAQATGITAKTYAITDTEGNEAATSTGKFSEITIADDTNYSVSATISYDAGNIPKTFLGKEYAEGQIKAGSKTATSAKVTGYRQGFYGTLTDKTGTIDSAFVRALSSKTNKKVAKAQKYAIAIPAGTVRVALAFESSVGEVSSITSVEQFNSEIKGSFDLHKIQVNDASGANPKEYNVYVKDMADAQASATTYNVTI